MRETTASLIPKEQLDHLKEDEKFIEFIKNELTKGISERLIQVLETNDDIVIKKPVLSVSEYPPLHSIEYRKTVDWEPLVRCKDCMYFDRAEKYCCEFLTAEEDGFCKWGERREE